MRERLQISDQEIQANRPKETHVALTAAGIAKFAKQWAGIFELSAQLDAWTVWLGTLQGDDFEFCLRRLRAVEMDYAGALDGFGDASREVKDLTGWVFHKERVARILFYERWVAAAPESVMQQMSSGPTRLAGELATYALPYLWVRDPDLAEATLAEVLARKPENFEQSRFSDLLYQLSEVAAVRWIIGGGAPGEGIRVLIYNYGLQDGEAILPEVMKLQGDSREPTLGLVFEAIAKHQPGKIKRLLERYAEDLEEPVLAHLRTIEKSVWILEEPESRINIETDFYTLKKWVANDPDRALAWALESPERLRQILHTQEIEISDLSLDYLLAWEKASYSTLSYPLEALSDAQFERYLAEIPTGAVIELYRRDPDRAIAMVATVENRVERHLAVSDISKSVGADPERREAWFAGLSEQDRNRGAERFFTAWAKDDPAEAFAHSAGTPWAGAAALDEWLKYEDVENIYQPNAARIAESEDLLRHVVDAWSMRDPQAAAEAFIADGLEQTMPRVMLRWLTVDSLAASEFIRENLEPGGSRDLSVSYLVKTIAKEDPAAAKEWAATIGDDALRIEAEALLQVLAP